MSSRSEVAGRLASVVAALDGWSTSADRICEATRLVAGADGAAVSLAQPDGGLERVSLSSAGHGAARLEEIQDAFGEGPAFDALLGDVAVDVSSVEMVSRWPLFAGSVIRDVHVVRVCAVPMHGGADVLGVLTLILAHAGPFAFGRRELAFLADAAASALSARSPADHLVTQLAWDGRSAVNRATGMVMAQLAIPAVDALALMRAHAYAIDATLQDVARQVLQRTLVFRPPDRP